MASNWYFTTAGLKDVNECPDGMFDGYVLHHTAWASGYVPRNKNCSGFLFEEYHGRFGDGYKVHMHADSSTIFHLVAYWVK